MAERITRQLIDDLDGTEIPDGSGESLSFSLRDSVFHIDLSAANVAKLEKALKPFVDAGVRARQNEGMPSRSGRGRTKPSRRRKNSTVQMRSIREWAQENGYEVSGRGRIKAEIVEAFEAAQS